MRAREAISRERLSHEAAIARFKDAEADARFLVSTQRRALMKKEAESAALQGRIRALLSKVSAKGSGFQPSDVESLLQLSQQPLSSQNVDEKDDSNLVEGRRSFPLGGSPNRSSLNGALASELSDVIGSLQAQLQEQREAADATRAELATTAEALVARDSEISRLGGLLADSAVAGGAYKSSSKNNVSSDSVAAAASSQRLIQQLTEQVDFLSAELALQSNGLNKDGKRNSTNSSSQVAALELELTRVATRLEAATVAKNKAEEQTLALRAEVASMMALVAESRAAARLAAEQNSSSSDETAFRAEQINMTAIDANSNHRAGSSGISRVGPAKAKAELTAALRELSRLQAEHARLAASAEAVGSDREQAIREMRRLEGALADAHSRLAMQQAAASAAAADAKEARGAAERATEEARDGHERLVSTEIALGERNASIKKLKEQLEQCDAELASLRPLVDRQAADNTALRAQASDLRSQLSQSTIKNASLSSIRDELSGSVRAAEGQAARSSFAADELSRESSALKREVGALTEALREAKDSLASKEAEMSFIKGASAEQQQRIDSLSQELSDLQSKEAASARLAASAQEQAARAAAAAGMPAEVAALRAESGTWRQRATAAEISADVAGRARERAETRARDLTREVEALRSAAERAGSALAAAERRESELTGLKNDLEASLRAVQAERDHEREMIKANELDRKRLSDEISDARASISRAADDAEAAREEKRAAEDRAAKAERKAQAARAEAESFAVSASDANALRSQAEIARDMFAADMRAAARKVENAMNEANVCRREANEAESAVEQARAQTRLVEEKCAEANRQVDQFKALFVQLDRTREASSNQLVEAMERVDHLQAKLREANADSVAVRRQLEDKTAECTKLVTALERLEADGDALAADMDALSERFSALQRSDSDKARALATSKAEIELSRAECAKALQSLAARDRDVQNARRECEQFRKSLADVSAERDAARSEFSNAAEDVTVMTRQNQAVSEELRQSRKAANDFRMQLEAGRTQLSQCEEANATLQQEKIELLNLFGTLQQERLGLVEEIKTAIDVRESTSKALVEAQKLIQDLSSELDQANAAQVETERALIDAQTRLNYSGQ